MNIQLELNAIVDGSQLTFSSYAALQNFYYSQTKLNPELDIACGLDITTTNTSFDLTIGCIKTVKTTYTVELRNQYGEFQSLKSIGLRLGLNLEEFK